MNLDPEQRKKVTEWIAQGLKLSEIQTRLASELGAKMTYMDVRLLVDDLKLTPKDVDPPKSVTATLPSQPTVTPPESPAGTPAGVLPKPNGVSVKVDQIARPGALASGKVTFSDG